MAISFATRAILEKAAVDNGFSLGQEAVAGWLIWRAHAAPASICLTATDAGYGVGSDHSGAIKELRSGLGEFPTAPAGFRVVYVQDTGMLNETVATIWRLARSLPDEPLRQYRRRLAEPPATTEVERLRKERIGQDVFREALMFFWGGACAVTGARHPRLLRASHIVPWADCPTDAERLNVHNGLLLAAHLDAAFDAHLISFGVDGKIQFSPELSEQDIDALGLVPEMCLRRTDPEIEARLSQHRSKLTGR